MRVTHNTIQQETLAAVRNAMAGLADAQRRVATGRRIHQPSDDPVAVAGLLRANRGLDALKQYGRNINVAEGRLRAEEQALDSVTNLLTRAKELAVASLSVTVDGTAREAIKHEVDGLLEAVVDQANMRHGAGFLFGGATADIRPFEADGAVADGARPAGTHKVDIGGSNWFATNHDGDEVFLQTGVFTALQELSTALESGDAQAIEAARVSLDGAFDGIQQKLSSVGARMNRLEVARANVSALDINLQTLRSDLQDTEIEEAVADLVGRQLAYQSALLAASRILSTTLTDYLR